jgi:hypothetical protein
MIKPGTLCMIRGVPEERYGSDFNGSVVVANGFKNPEALIYWIEPPLFDSRGNRFTGCREQWLWPFEDPDTLLTSDLNKTLETV